MFKWGGMSFLIILLRIFNGVLDNCHPCTWKNSSHESRINPAILLGQAVKRRVNRLLGRPLLDPCSSERQRETVSVISGFAKMTSTSSTPSFWDL